MEGLIFGILRYVTKKPQLTADDLSKSLHSFTCMAIHTIHYLLEKDLKILGSFPEINQKAEEMGGRAKGDQATRQFETIHVIIIEAALLFCTPSPSMFILKKF